MQSDSVERWLLLLMSEETRFEIRMLTSDLLVRSRVLVT